MTWRHAINDPPPLRKFVILIDETSWEVMGNPPLQTLYLGWLDQTEEGEEGVKFFWWADPGGELYNVTRWHELPPLPPVATDSFGPEVQ